MGDPVVGNGTDPHDEQEKPPQQSSQECGEIQRTDPDSRTEYYDEWHKYAEREEKLAAEEKELEEEKKKAKQWQEQMKEWRENRPPLPNIVQKEGENEKDAAWRTANELRQEGLEAHKDGSIVGTRKAVELWKKGLTALQKIDNMQKYRLDYSPVKA